ncbi:MAG: hypothetical protein COA62_06015 [Rhodobiaceae bacterium]|nr:MAG: hypothetical protein COA62_06015 [Rhodobiaceae bacterium]
MENHGKFIGKIRKEVSSGKLAEPFRSTDVEKSCPGFAKSTYTTFLAKHSVGNPGKTTELFERVDRGLYRLKP